MLFHLSRLLRPLTALMLLSLTSITAGAAEPITIGYLQLIEPRPPLLSNVLPEPEDSGLQGARLGIDDNNASGRFMGQNYLLREARSKNPDQLLEQADRWYHSGTRLLVASAPAPLLARLSLHFADRDMVIFNAGSPDNALRTSECHANLLHTLPSRAMLADALAQWLISRKLSRWLLVSGPRAEDKAYAGSIHRSARRYGARIVAEKDWTFDTDLRRTAQAEVPLFTQTEEYDVLVVADEPGDFGEFLLYNSWYPRPVVGTQGLTPTAWHRVVEQWGAAQLQRRFDKQAGRWMNAEDYAAWAAVRSIGEAIAQGAAISGNAVRNRLLSESFQLAGFKGRKLTYRPWNGQLRQPVPLVHPRALVSQSPQEGFLHPVTDLDTLGFDRPESECQLQQHAGVSS